MQKIFAQKNSILQGVSNKKTIQLPWVWIFLLNEILVKASYNGRIQIHRGQHFALFVFVLQNDSYI